MRTTIILSDELGERLRERARQEGMSFSSFLANAGRKALESRPAAPRAAFRLITFRGDGPLKGVDLDRTNELIAAEDERFYAGRPE